MADWSGRSRSALTLDADEIHKIIEARRNDFSTFGPFNHIDRYYSASKLTAHVKRNQFSASVTSKYQEAIEVRPVIIP